MYVVHIPKYVVYTSMAFLIFLSFDLFEEVSFACPNAILPPCLSIPPRWKVRCVLGESSRKSTRRKWDSISRLPNDTWAQTEEGDVTQHPPANQEDGRAEQQQGGEWEKVTFFDNERRDELGGRLGKRAGRERVEGISISVMGEEKGGKENKGGGEKTSRKELSTI